MKEPNQALEPTSTAVTPSPAGKPPASAFAGLPPTPGFRLRQATAGQDGGTRWRDEAAGDHAGGTRGSS